MTTKSLVSLSMVCALFACGPKDDDEASAGTSEATGSTGAATEGTGSTGTTGVPFEPYEARGVVITRVEANSGVAVPIGLDGAAVPGSGRNAYIPSQRDTLIRGFLDTEEGWTPRDLEGRLTLRFPDGTEKVISEIFTINGDTVAGQLTSGMYFGLKAEDMVPGLQYSLSVWETAWGQEGVPASDPPPQLPIDGSFAPVGVEDVYLNMRVVLVPVDYSYGSCQKVVDGEGLRKSFEDAIFQENPLQGLEFEVHAPYKVNYDLGEFNGLSDLVNDMSQLRAAEGAEPNVYYYAIFDNCNKCIGAGGGISSGCTVGLAANITGAQQSDAWGRAAAGQLNSTAADTFVHEIGHTQGRRHIYCASAGVQAQGTDPSYPYEDGQIHVWGFGIRDLGLRHPTATADYMSYCGNTWCSDWQWNATYARIKTLSSWEMAGAPAPGDGLLIGAITPDGHESWWTAPGSFDGSEERSATHSVRFDFGGRVVDVAAQVSVRPHYPVLNVVVPLPTGFDAEAPTLRLAAPEGEREITVAPEKLFHRRDHLVAR